MKGTGLRRLAGLLRRLAAPFRSLARRLRYRLRALAGQPAGTAFYAYDPAPAKPVGPWCLEVRLPAGAVDRGEAEAWARAQTLGELRVVAIDASGAESWRWQRREVEGAEARFVYLGASGESDPVLPALYPAYLESAVLVLAAEAVDALVLEERLAAEIGPGSIEELLRGDAEPCPRLLGRTVFAARSWSFDGLRPRAAVESPRLVHIEGRGKMEPDAPGVPRGPRRRGSYLFARDPGPRARLGLRDAGRLPRLPAAGDPRPAVLVMVPFLARGGAEHTLFETLHALRHRFRFSFVTVAGHLPRLGDRRQDFERFWPRLYCLGDLVHPAAMPGLLDSILRSTGARILYNANGSTLFYDFAPGLRRRHPDLRILDHLYDHRVGYIERYDDPDLLDSVDAVVAENHPIAEALDSDYGWPLRRAPVIWPCGRSPADFPPAAERPSVRRTLRRELGYGEGDVVVLTAARMHPQKRPLDLVALARRLADLERLHLLIVGGGELEAEVDRAIAESGDGATPGPRIRRLPFRTDIPALIVACDAGCLVSDYEGLPVFLLECLQAGRPFVGTDVGELGRVLESTGAGWCVETPGDLDALEAAFRQLCEEAERAERAERARAAGPRFAPEACAERYAEVFLGRDPGPQEL
ncbi:MAG: glycosyltransferase family 4 protein [Holophagales bacterium]|nr:glycosyltransferase family 4 protein [Holophagales bacterium]